MNWDGSTIPPPGFCYDFDAEKFRRFMGRPGADLSVQILRSIAMDNASLGQLFVVLTPYVIVEEEW